ncbi:MAG: hypothetical protein ACK5LL_01380 [Suipraeoptans sp.]
MINNRKFSLIYRIFVLLFIFWGISDNINFFNPFYIARKMMYFTMQSSLLALALMSVLIIRTIMDIKNTGTKGSSAYYPIVEKCCIVNLLLTATIYWMVLLPDKFTMGHKVYMASFENLSVHVFIPLLILLDYIMFCTPVKNRYLSVYVSLIYPTFYGVLAVIVSFTGLVFRISPKDKGPVYFPYNFLDYSREGLKCILYILVIMVIILAFSHLMYFLDRKLFKLKQTDAIHLT